MKDFFLLGCSRSGTTMLATQLNKTKEIIIPPETWWLSNAQYLGVKRIESDFILNLFLNKIKESIQVAQNEEMDKAFLSFYDSIKGFRGSYDELFREFASYYKSYFNTKLFGEKTPAHTTFMNELNETFSDFKKLILLRDPRDIVYSYFNAWFELNNESLYKILKILKVYLYNILHLAEGDVYFVKYEELTENVEMEIQKIKKFLSLNDNNDKKASIDEKNVFTAKPTGIHANLSKPVFKNSGKYKKLPIEMQQIIESVLYEEMSSLGYDFDHEKKSLKGTIFENIEEDVKQQLQRNLPKKLSKNWNKEYIHRLRTIAHIIKNKVKNK